MEALSSNHLLHMLVNLKVMLVFFVLDVWWGAFVNGYDCIFNIFSYGMHSYATISALAIYILWLPSVPQQEVV